MDDVDDLEAGGHRGQRCPEQPIRIVALEAQRAPPTGLQGAGQRRHRKIDALEAKRREAAEQFQAARG